MKRRQSSKGGAIVIGTGGTRSTKSTSCQSPASPLCFAWTGRDLNSSTLVRVILFILDVYLSTTLGWCYGNAKGDGDHSNSLEYMQILLEPLCASDLSQPSHAPTFINLAYFHDFSHSTRYHIVPLLYGIDFDTRTRCRDNRCYLWMLLILIGNDSLNGCFRGASSMTRSFP